MSFSCTDKDTLVSYIYGECDETMRRAVDSHLAECPGCADEVSGFGVVREQLSQWAPPERAGGFRLVRDEEATAPATVLRPARWWQAGVPYLARAAAAILLVAGGAALANLEVRYDAAGFLVRTGWQKVSPAAVRVTAPGLPAQPAPQPAAAPVVRGDTPADPALVRAELAAFQRQINEVRQQVAAVKTSAPGPVQATGNVAFDEERLRQWVYTALDESERRQQVNVATYMSRLASDLQAGRSIDMRRIGFDALPPALLQQPRQRTTPNMFDVSLPVKK